MAYRQARGSEGWRVWGEMALWFQLKGFLSSLSSKIRFLVPRAERLSHYKLLTNISNSLIELSYGIVIFDNLLDRKLYDRPVLSCVCNLISWQIGRAG